MRFPAPHEWVRIEGREGVFLIVSIDRSDGIAAVVPAGGTDIERIPLALILPLDIRAQHYAA